MTQSMQKPLTILVKHPTARAEVAAQRKQFAIGAQFLALVVVAAYWPTLSSSFVQFDDPQYVTENSLVLRPSWSGVARFFAEVRKPSTVAGYYQPLTMVSFMLDALATGGGAVDPAVCHLHNILLHAVTCVLVFALLRRTAGGFAIPLVLAIVYAVHPVNVESVAWIAQRKTVLATPLALGSLICYLRFGSGGEFKWFVSSLCLYLLATLAKPTIVLMPLVLPLLDVWPLNRPILKGLPEKLPFAVVMVAMGYIAYVSQASSLATLGVPNFASADVLARWIALLSYNLMLYLGNIFWPLYLAPFRPVPQSLSFTYLPILLSAFGAVALAGWWIASWRWSKPFFGGLAAFLVTLALALGPLRFFDSCVADRFLYFPIVFLLLPAAAAIVKIESLSDRPIKLLRYAVLMLVVPLLILMRGQQTIWRDGRTFWTHVAETVPDYATAHLNLGFIDLSERKFDDAFKHARKAMELRPDDALHVSLLAHVLIEQGKATEAVNLLTDALKEPLSPDAGAAYIALAESRVVTSDLEGAKAACRKAIELKQPESMCYERLGNMALQKTLNFGFAEACYREAVKCDPENLTANWNVGTALEAAGHGDAALMEYEAALARYEKRGHPMPELRQKVMTLRLKMQSSTSRPGARGK